MNDEPRQPILTPPSPRPRDDSPRRDDRACWLCGAPTVYQRCKIICTTCHFTRDCSDP